jgi:hypothetical protein
MFPSYNPVLQTLLTTPSNKLIKFTRFVQFMTDCVAKRIGDPIGEAPFEECATAWLLRLGPTLFTRFVFTTAPGLGRATYEDALTEIADAVKHNTE